MSAAVEVFQVAVRGEWAHVVDLMTSMPEDDWSDLVLAVGGLQGLLGTVARSRSALAGAVDACVPTLPTQDPPAGTSG